jgi:hypothetical protein
MSLQCPACTAPLPERAYFCAACAAPVRCKHCQELLELNARACIMCGAPLGTNGAKPANDPTMPVMNTFELEEDPKSRTVRLRLTDHAVANVGEALSYVFADRITTRHRPSTATRIVQHTDGAAPPLLLPPDPATEETTDDDNSTPTTAATTPATEPSSDEARLRHIFEHQGEDLRLEEDDLKAVSLQDYARRLTYLFLYAHELEGRKPLAYDALKKILETAKVWDPNTRYAVQHKLALEIQDNTIRLKKAGRTSAIQALDEILNPNHPSPGWTPETRTRSSKAGNDAKASGGKPGRKRSTQGEDWAKQWEKHAEHINGHFALKDKKVPDKVILALWAIHKVGGKAASARYVQRFIKAAFSYDEKERTIAMALQRKTADDLVIKTEGGYKLTPTGTKHADALAKAAKA